MSNWYSITERGRRGYTVLASTNVAAPINTWSSLGPPVESSAGVFKFTDLAATNYTERYYRVRSP